MRLSSLWLAAGLWSVSTLAAEEKKASLKGWDVHSNCEDYEWMIEGSFTEALKLAEAAKAALEVVLNPLPRIEDEDAYLRWQAIAYHIRMAFGYKIPSNMNKDKKAQERTESLRDVYAKAARVLPLDVTDPPRGYNPRLASRPGAKPKIICSDDVFKWYDADEEPEEGAGLVRDQEGYRQMADAGRGGGRGTPGAFYFDGRWHFMPTKPQSGSIELCKGNRMALASSHDDLLLLCPLMLSDDEMSRAWPSAWKGSVTSGTKIQSGLVSNPTSIWHELIHWFGGVDSNLRHIIKDHNEVNERGQLIYKNKITGEEYVLDTPLNLNLPENREIKKQGTYGYKAMVNLANNKGNPANWGPDKATTSCDSLMIFSVMMYNDQWDWTKNGVARDFGKFRLKLGLPRR